MRATSGVPLHGLWNICPAVSASTAVSAVGRRRQDEDSPELSGEVAQVAESGHRRDLFDRLVGMDQRGGGPAQTLPDDVLVQRNTVFFREEPIEMATGKADGTGELVGFSSM